jgi:hypothetical protein
MRRPPSAFSPFRQGGNWLAPPCRNKRPSINMVCQRVNANCGKLGRRKSAERTRRSLPGLEVCPLSSQAHSVAAAAAPMLRPPRLETTRRTPRARFPALRRRALFLQVGESHVLGWWPQEASAKPTSVRAHARCDPALR